MEMISREYIESMKKGWGREEFIGTFPPFDLRVEKILLNARLDYEESMERIETGIPIGLQFRLASTARQIRLLVLTRTYKEACDAGYLGTWEMWSEKFRKLGHELNLEKLLSERRKERESGTGN